MMIFFLLWKKKEDCRKKVEDALNTKHGAKLYMIVTIILAKCAVREV